MRFLEIEGRPGVWRVGFPALSVPAGRSGAKMPIARFAPGWRTAGNVAVVVARVVLGLIFTTFGSNGFLQFIPAPPLGGTAGAFMGAMLASHYVLLVSGAEVLGGILLLANRFIPLAVVLLAAVIANILTFHLTMLREGLPMALVVTALWVIVALPLRSVFAPLFAAKVS